MNLSQISDLKKKIIALTGILLFIGLGVKFIPLYSLWDDESNTTLLAQSVRTTGDTTGVHGANIISYRGGVQLDSNNKIRYDSPFQFYFLAPFIDSTIPEPIRARIPFFILSIISLILIYRRLILLKLPTPILLFWMGLSLGLSPFVLFSLQIRYYPICFLWSILLVEMYWFRDLTRKRDFFFASLIVALNFVTNYLVGATTAIALGLHALVFRRDRKYLTLLRITALIIPQLLISLPVLLIWNPIGKSVTVDHNTLIERGYLFFRNIRDFNGGHFGSVILLVLGLFLFKGATRNRFRQYALIFVAYLFSNALFSPQSYRGTMLADIRYYYPLTLLGISWTLDFGHEVLKRYPRRFYAFLFMFSFVSLPYSGKLEFPLLNLVRELKAPADDPYRVVSDWLNQKAETGKAVLTSIEYSIYPLMYLAPQFHYLGQGARDGAATPTYLVSFCNDAFFGSKFSEYEVVAEFTISCREKFRPEIFLRNFGLNQERGSVKILKIKKS